MLSLNFQLKGLKAQLIISFPVHFRKLHFFPAPVASSKCWRRIPLTLQYSLHHYSQLAL